MAKGKQTCKILKEIRKQIAEENDIELVIEECTYKGDCLGTCPRCEAEVRYLERELEKRQRLGKVAVFAGMSLGTILASTSCDSTEAVVNKRPLAGDVVAVEPIAPPDPNDQLMGKVPLLRLDFPFDATVYQQLLKELFVFPKMENLSIVSGVIEYEHIGRGEACTTLEKLVAATKEFSAPYYPDGEQKLMEDLAAAVKNSPFEGEVNNGVMEVEFTVTQSGKVEDVSVKESVNPDLDAVVIAAFEKMRWIPASCELNDRTKFPFTCRCTKSIPFPIKKELVIGQEDLMGLVAMYNPVLIHVDSVRQEVRDKMVLPETRNLTVKGYELQIPESLYGSYREGEEAFLIEKATRIVAPQYPEGEAALMQLLAEALGKNAIKHGEVEVEFSVHPSGRVHDVEIIKGIDEETDAKVSGLFKMMDWDPGAWIMESGEQIMISCRCAQKIQFPILPN